MSDVYTRYNPLFGAPTEEDDTGTWTWSDMGKGLGAVGLDIAGGAAANLRHYSDPGSALHDLGKSLQQYMNEEADLLREDMSPSGKRLANAPMTSTDFWEQPFASLGLKAGINIAPLAVSAVPAILATGPVAATLAAGVASGLISESMSINDVYSMLDSFDDSTLRGKSEYYKNLREGAGMNEEEARHEYAQNILGYTPELLAAVGFATGAFGPAAQVGKIGKGIGGASSRLGNMGAAAGESAASEFAQSGAEDVFTQRALIKGGVQDEFSGTQLANAMIEGATIGAIYGSVAGAAHKKTGSGERPVSEETPTPVTRVEPGDTSPEQEKAFEAIKPIKTKPDADKLAPVPEAMPVPPPAEPRQTATPTAPAQPIQEPAPEPTQQGLPPIQPDQQAAPAQQQGLPPIQPDQQAAPAQQAAPQPRRTVSYDTVMGPNLPTRAEPAVIGTTPEGKRILNDTTQEAANIEEINRVRTTAALQEKADRANEAETKRRKDESTGDTNESRLAAKTKAGAEADKMLGIGRAKPRQMPVPENRAQAEAILGAAQKFIEMANEKGIDVKQSIHAQVSSAGQIFLREAQDFVNHPETKNASLVDRAREFVTYGNDLLAGNKDMTLEKRKVEGAAASRVGSSAGLENIASGPYQTNTMSEASTVAARPEAQDAAPAVAESAMGSARTSVPTEERVVKRKGGGSRKDEVAAAAKGSDRKVETTEELKAKYEKMLADVSERNKRRATVQEPTKAEKTNEPSEPKQDEGGFDNLKAAEEEMVTGKKKVAAEPEEEVTSKGKKAVAKVKEKAAEKKATQKAKVKEKAKPEKFTEWDQVDEDIHVRQSLDSPNQQIFLPNGAIVQRGMENGKVTYTAIEGNMSETQISEVFRAFDSKYGDLRATNFAESPKGWSQAEPGPSRMSASDKFKAFRNKQRTKKAAAKSRFTDENGMLQHGKKKIAPTKYTTAAQALDEINPAAAFPGVSGKLMQQVADTLRNLVGDFEVFYVTDEDSMAYHGKDVSGAWTPLRDGVYLDREGGYVMINEWALRDGRYHSWVVLHELTHAATSIAIDANPDHETNVQSVMDVVKDYIDTLPKDEKARVWNDIEYAFKNTKEFVAEALSNPKVQSILMRIEVPEDIALPMGLDTSRAKSMWDVAVEMVRRFLGLGQSEYTALDAIMRVTDVITSEGIDYIGPNTADAIMRIAGPDYSAKDAVKGWVDDLGTAVKQRVTGEGLLQQNRAPIRQVLMALTSDQIAQKAKDFWTGKNPVRKVVDLIEKIRVTAHDKLVESAPLIRKLDDLQRKYKDTPHWEKFVKMIHDETISGVFADRSLDNQSHLGKDAMKGWWAKSRHAELHKAFKELERDAPDLIAARREAMLYFTKRQNEMALGIIRNRILAIMGLDHLADADAMAERIHTGTTTRADEELLGPMLDLIEEAGVLAKIDGPYFPLMRRGDYAVVGKFNDFTDPDWRLAEQQDNNTWDFYDRKEAQKFVQSLDRPPEVKSIWVGEDDGKQWYTDTRTGKEVKYRADDHDSVQRFRVRVQDEFLSFEKDAFAGRKLAQELIDQGYTEVGVELRKFDTHDHNVDLASHQLQNLIHGLQKRQGYMDMSPEQKNEVIQAINEASIRYAGATRIQSRRLPRRKVEGYSKDFVWNTHDYAKSSGGYLARLEHMPELEAAMKNMRDTVAGDYSKESRLGRSVIANEIEKRVYHQSAFSETGVWNAISKRAMTAAFSNYLMSPMYSVVNATQVAMLTLPHLAARHGAGKAAAALLKVYKDADAKAILAEGLKATITKAKNPTAAPPNFFDDVIGRFKGKEQSMLRHLRDIGLLEADVGLEVEELLGTGSSGALGTLDTSLEYLQGVARQMPRAIEMINRTVSAVAAYRLEMKKNGGDHEAAVLYAQEATSMTQGNYSATNQPEFFNNPLVRMSLQFKKYAQLVYGLLGHHIGRIIRNAHEGDREESIKTLAYMVGTHMAMAGALGLPTEPLRYMVIVSAAVGIHDYKWTDAENWVRENAAALFGPTMGEVFSRGITRALPEPFAFDLSSRVGLADVTSFGEPKSMDKDGLGAWFMELVGGAPGSMAMDWIGGANSLVEGDFTKAAEKLVPVKMARDSIKAYRVATEGKKTEAGRPSMDPYSLPEAVIKGFGATPAREAENSARKAAYYTQTKREKTRRDKIMQDYYEATPDERARMWRVLDVYNQGKKREERLTRAYLNDYVRRRKQEEINGTMVDGMRITKNDKQIFETTGNTYSYQQR